MSCEITCKAILFDMDGTLVDSTKSVEAVWRQWAEKQGVDLVHLLAISHGRRTVDTLRDIAPQLDIEAEAEALERQEINSEEGVEEVSGAAHLIRLLPIDRWAVVTSASRPLAEARLRVAGLPIPRILVSSSDVEFGKPHPEGYLLAAAALETDPADCLVLEDTPAGIEAARAACMQVVAITTTYPPSELLGSICISNFKDAKVLIESGSLHLHL